MWQLVGKLDPCAPGGHIFRLSSCCQETSITVPKHLDSALLTAFFRSKNWIRYDKWIFPMERLESFSLCKRSSFVCVVWSLLPMDYEFSLFIYHGNKWAFSLSCPSNVTHWTFNQTTYICIFPLFLFWGSVSKCALASGFDLSLLSGLIANTAKKNGSVFQIYRWESIFTQSIIGADWHGEGHFSALLLPEVDYVQIIIT